MFFRFLDMLSDDADNGIVRSKGVCDSPQMNTSTKQRGFHKLRAALKQNAFSDYITRFQGMKTPKTNTWPQCPKLLFV
jgi:hypothetical protein